MMSLYSRITGKLTRIYLHIRIFIFNLWNSLTGPSRLRSAVKQNTPPANFESIYSSGKREIEILQSDKELSEVIFACYFVHQADPIQGMIRRTPDINYIAPWYKSIEKIGVTGIIVHDGLDEDFIAKHQTDGILFRKYRPGLYSIFEERWFAFYLFLSQTNIKHAFISDINDVYITKNPFEILTNDLALYVGKDNANKIKNSEWMLAELAEFEKDSGIKAPFLYRYQHAYNAGVMGGSRVILLFLMSRVICYILLTKTSSHKDMTLLNLCIHEHFFPRIGQDLFNPRLTTKEDDIRAAHEYLVTGYPFNSDFQKQQLNSDAYFIHK
ncbi:MAG: hypothetical protein JWO03_3186 [Bacteroidetes bacterium]|nr:hypothetical protein [Bacteroidota bacterium]